MIRTVIAAACLLSNAAWSASSIDARYVSGSHEIDDDDSDTDVEIETDGFEGRAHVELSREFFLRGSYLDASGDDVEVNGSDVDVDVDTTIARVGAGYQFETSVMMVSFTAEYTSLELEIEGLEADDDGGTVTAGVRDLGTGKLFWYAEVGTSVLGDLETGSTLDAGIGYRFSPHVAMFLAAQGYYFEDDDDVEYEIFHGSIGARFTF